MIIFRLKSGYITRTNKSLYSDFRWLGKDRELGGLTPWLGHCGALYLMDF